MGKLFSKNIMIRVCTFIFTAGVLIMTLTACGNDEDSSAANHFREAKSTTKLG